MANHRAEDMTPEGRPAWARERLVTALQNIPERPLPRPDTLAWARALIATGRSEHRPWVGPNPSDFYSWNDPILTTDPRQRGVNWRRERDRRGLESRPSNQRGINEAALTDEQLIAVEMARAEAVVKPALRSRLTRVVVSSEERARLDHVARLIEGNMTPGETIEVNGHDYQMRASWSDQRLTRVPSHALGQASEFGEMRPDLYASVQATARHSRDLEHDAPQLARLTSERAIERSRAAGLPAPRVAGPERIRVALAGDRGVE